MRDRALIHWAKKVPRFLLRLGVSTVVVSTFFVVTQDFHIFPGLYSSLFFGYTSTPPKGVEALTTTAADGQRVNIWRMRVNRESQKAVALLFHGNAEHLDHFVQVQQWLKSIGITSYSVEYRGYNGRNSGWPSEDGFYSDAEAALKLLQHEESIDSHDVIILGSSIGTGTAAFIAQKYNTGTLVLLSPYSSLRDVVAETPFLGYLASFLKYNFPCSDYIRNLTHTCVVAAHGKIDSTIPFEHSERLRSIYHGDATFTLIESEDAGHNDLLAHAHEEISRAIQTCIEQIHHHNEQTS